MLVLQGVLGLLLRNNSYFSESDRIDELEGL
jgi:hypothetical protein